MDVHPNFANRPFLEEEARSMQGFGYKAKFSPILSGLPWANIPSK